MQCQADSTTGHWLDLAFEGIEPDGELDPTVAKRRLRHRLVQGLPARRGLYGC